MLERQFGGSEKKTVVNVLTPADNIAINNLEAL